MPPKKSSLKKSANNLESKMETLIGKMNSGMKLGRVRKKGRPTRVPGLIPSFTIGGATGRSRPSLVQSGPLGMIRTTGVEYLADLKSMEDVFNLYGATMIPGVSGLPHLDKLGKIHGRYRWNALSFEYRPSVGTTTAGTATMAIDSNYKDTLQKTKADLYTLQPNLSTPLYKAGRLVVPKPLLMPVPWLETRRTISNPPTVGELSDCFSINFYYGIDGKFGGTKAAAFVAGEIWCHYDVTLYGPENVLA